MRMSSEINEIAEALAKAQGAIENAAKDSLNPHFKSSYADLASVREAIREPLSSNGIAYTQFVRGGKGTIEIETMLLHKSGQFLAETLEIPLAKNDAQAIGSATSYGRRYSLMAIVGIAAGDDDDGEAAMQRNSGPVQQSQAPRQQQRIRSADDLRSASQRMADDMIVAINKRPTIESLIKFRKIPDVIRDFDLLDEEDQARVNSAEVEQRRALEARAPKLQAGE